MKRTLTAGMIVALAFSFGALSGDALASPMSALPGYALENGDVNGDWERDLSDTIFLMGHLFLGGPEPVPLALCAGDAPSFRNGDTNGDAEIDVSDPIHLLEWLFLGGPDPASPCGDGSGAARNENPRVIPVNARPHGKSYGEWSAAWWQWAFSLPEANHPLLDTGDCGEGQTRGVWFLGGSFATATAERNCTVPEGTSLFFPIINAECSSLEPDPYYCEDEATCRACSEAFMTAEDVLGLTVDGVEVTNLQSYRVQSGLFELGPLPDGAIFGLPGGATGVSAGDGYYVMLAPLSKGEHRIEFTGCFGAFGGCEGFQLEIGYDINVD